MLSVVCCSDRLVLVLKLQLLTVVMNLSGERLLLVLSVRRRLWSGWCFDDVAVEEFRRMWCW